MDGWDGHGRSDGRDNYARVIKKRNPLLLQQAINYMCMYFVMFIQISNVKFFNWMKMDFNKILQCFSYFLRKRYRNASFRGFLRYLTPLYDCSKKIFSFSRMLKNYDIKRLKQSDTVTI